jgi:hypothetical protein
MASHVLDAGLELLPPAMNTRAARAMLLSIGLQESRFMHRSQVGGPARGFWQFERGGLYGVMTHSATRAPLTIAMQRLRYGNIVGQLEPMHLAITHNDILACVVARLLLWTVPGVLPSPQEPLKGWQQYLDGWRPGKPHPETWDAFFTEAWSRVSG